MFVQEIIRLVLVTLIAVATPFSASVLLPVVPSHASTSVSVVIAIVMSPQLVSFTNVIAVPIGYATDELAGIVRVLAVVSALGWYMCFQASAKTSVYAALLEFCGIFLYHTSMPPLPSNVSPFTVLMFVQDTRLSCLSLLRLVKLLLITVLLSHTTSVESIIVIVAMLLVYVKLLFLRVANNIYIECTSRCSKLCSSY